MEEELDLLTVAGHRETGFGKGESMKYNPLNMVE